MAAEKSMLDWETFRTPPSTYREVPFWSWNDRLEPGELCRQIDEMDRAGWGGFFMHARVGLRTPYMGPQWIECVRACVEKARSRGMGAWLYDEDKWPSGFAGGLSVAAHPEYRAQALLCKVDDRPAFLAERIATFGAREVAGELVDFVEQAPALSGSGERLVQFYVQTMPLGDAWFNDYTYLDLLNPAAVQAFLESTHELYARALGEEFGKTIPGIFTDEPCLLFHSRRWLGTQPAVPWTEGFARYFQEQAGYDLLPYLPSLFFDTGDWVRVRYDYWKAVTRRFVEAYSRPYFEWCQRHGLAYTGHYMAEDTLYDQIRWIGAAMPHYFYMHVPGIDKLEREINRGAGTVLTVKQLDSVACQAGKKRTLCENYGCSGQDFSHTGRKWIGDWAYVLGINLNNPHLALYSLRGERKRDYPADLFFQQPWWPENGLVADYFARLSYALSQGRRVVDILVIHPVGSAWASYRPGAARSTSDLDQALDEIGMTLLSHQRDFHLADEMLLEHELPGRIFQDDRGPALAVGEMVYRLVVVPPGVTLAANTVRLLHDFAAAGGPVLAVDPAPYLVDGRPANTPVLPASTRHVTVSGVPGFCSGMATASGVPELCSGMAPAAGTLVTAIDELLPWDVRVAGHPSVWVHHRRCAEQDLYFFANTSLEVDPGSNDFSRFGYQPVTIKVVTTNSVPSMPGSNDLSCSGGLLVTTKAVITEPSAPTALEQETRVLVSLRGNGILELWDPTTGGRSALPRRQRGDIIEVELELPPVGSRLLILSRSEAPSADAGLLPDANRPESDVSFHPLPNDWTLEPAGPNSLTLDRARLRLGEGPWSEPLDILEAHGRVVSAGVGTPFQLAFAFDAETVPPAPLYLVLESPERFVLAVNGQAVDNADQGRWIDPSFRRVDISAPVRRGHNEVVLSGRLARDSELESAYLVGAFGLRAQRRGREGQCNGQLFDRYGPAFALVEPPARLVEQAEGLAVDLTAQGLPFFAGRATLRRQVELPVLPAAVFLEIEQLRAAVAHIWVNGTRAGTMAWAPHRVEIGAYLHPGENEVAVELVGTLRNLLGPHHVAGGDSPSTGPESFRDRKRWTDDYILAPFGFGRAGLLY